MRLNNKGFSPVEVIALIGIVVIIGLVGWRVLGNQSDSGNSPQITSPDTAEGAPKVESSDDLKQAEEYLNDQDIDSQLDTSEMDQALAE